MIVKDIPFHRLFQAPLPRASVSIRKVPIVPAVISATNSAVNYSIDEPKFESNAGKEIPWGKIIIGAIVIAGVVYVGHRIYENYKLRKAEEKNQ